MKRLATLFTALTLTLAACTAVPSGIDPAYQVTDSALLGDWVSKNGTKVEIEHAGGKAFEVEVSDARSKATYRGHLLEISGKRFAEVSVHQPDGNTNGTPSGKNDAPVYYYAMVEISGDTMTHHPLRAEWLDQQSKNLPGAIYKSTSQEQPGSGGLIVQDRTAMLELLKKAASDPTAFSPAETLNRTKGK